MGCRGAEASIDNGTYLVFKLPLSHESLDIIGQLFRDWYDETCIEETYEGCIVPAIFVYVHKMQCGRVYYEVVDKMNNREYIIRDDKQNFGKFYGGVDDEVSIAVEKIFGPLVNISCEGNCNKMYTIAKLKKTAPQQTTITVQGIPLTATLRIDRYKGENYKHVLVDACPLVPLVINYIKTHYTKGIVY